MTDQAKPDVDPGKVLPPKPALEDKISLTKHTAKIGAKKIAYTVTTGTMVLRSESEKDGASEGEKPKATVFFVAYTRDDAKDGVARPITFSFNGGPGSSSVWLHLGVLGPKRVDLGQDGFDGAPPTKFIENEFSLLDQTDLVFIDPVGTGFSRATEGEKAKDFAGFKHDIESVGDFIRLYTTRHNRWLSPKFLIGESYGTTRAAGLSGYLQDRHGLYLNGIILVSVVLDFQTLLFDHGNDLPYVLILPSLTATAWYHGKISGDLPALLTESETFAVNEYSRALLLGASLGEKERAQIARKLARLTGLSREFIERCNLRPDLFRFTKELLRDQALTVGRLDSRYTGMDKDSAGERFEYDPSMSAISGPYTAAMNHYVRAELGFELDLPYEILSGKVWQSWSYAEFENKYVSVVDTLRQAMTKNPHLKVLVMGGYFDLATPYFAAEWTINHLGLDERLRANISSSVFDAGHMMYVHKPSLERMKAELSAFIRDALPK
jgi:carboxypeptidase C (cathepsin A)